MTERQRALGLVYRVSGGLLLSGLVGVAPLIAQASGVGGTVVDISGAPVPGATVAATGAGVVVTGDDGQFEIAAAGDAVSVTATAEGFAPSTVEATPGTADLVVVLHPAPVFDTVTVTASRGDERLDSAASTTVLSSADLMNMGAGALDDALRNTPGFTLFRRQNSRVANPTAQGGSLRGLSGSGASRTLVLADGVPLNDPFGSWVYWNRIPEAAIDRVEVVRGAMGDLYGADAVGGVIQVLTFDPNRLRVRGTGEYGAHETGRASAFAGGQHGRLTLSGAGEWLDTDGIVIVAEEERGAVDIPAGSDYRTGFATAGYEGDTWRLEGRASAYDEDRSNGTPVQINNTDWHQFAGDASGVAAGGAWRARVAGGSQTFFQTFSAVGDDRNSENLVRDQHAPADFVNYGAEWVRSLGRHTLMVGGEGKRIDSLAVETAYSFATGLPTGTFELGGEETSGSIFGQVALVPGDRLTVVLGARGDFWDSNPASAADPSHAVNFFSPRGSIAYQLSDDVALRGAAYRAYRTPTLNELHRGFRVGNIVTNPNPLLEPERLTGFDGGVLVNHGRASLRVTGFFNHLDDAIANITVATTPSLITRVRDNAGRIRAAGVEIESDYRPHPLWTVDGHVALTSSTFLDTPELPELEGNRVPQAPRYEIGTGVTFADPALATVSAHLRIVGAQFDDDQNELELGEYAVVDVYASRGLGHGLNAFIAVENLFDQTYEVRTNPTTTGWPRTMRAGVRVFLP